MYRPPKYRKDDKEYIFNFINARPFATLVVNGNRLLATHIPILCKGKVEEWKLFGHIANHNEQLEFLKDGTEVLLIFQGADAYISSSWYTEKDISTWDYSAVHVNAKIQLQTSEELEGSLKKLVARFEKGQEQPLHYEDLPEQMLKEHLPLITGFWLEPFKVEGVAKLHQSYSSENKKRVVEKLQNSDSGKEKELARDIQEENGMR